MKVSVFLSGVALLSAMLGATSTAHAEGNAANGKKLAYTCHGCHGIENYKNAYPTYSVPKIGGQNDKYILDALKGYASGDRAHATMHAHAASLSAQDYADIAAFLAVKVRATGQPKGTSPAAAATCVACHGADGISITPDYPNLAGQKRDYLEQALKDYKAGKRKNAVMAGIIGGVNEKDFPALAAFFAAQAPAVCTTDKIRDTGKCP